MDPGLGVRYQRGCPDLWSMDASWDRVLQVAGKGWLPGDRSASARRCDRAMDAQHRGLSLSRLLPGRPMYPTAATGERRRRDQLSQLPQRWPGTVLAAVGLVGKLQGRNL